MYNKRNTANGYKSSSPAPLLFWLQDKRKQNYDTKTKQEEILPSKWKSAEDLFLPNLPPMKVDRADVLQADFSP